MKFILVILVFIYTTGLFGLDFNKYLKSQIRSEITIQKIVNDEGDYPKALKFSTLAIKKYPNSMIIQLYRAKALYLTSNLDDSKILFMQILEKDPTNDIASDFIDKIEKQEEANKNKDLEEIFEYMSDKGFDFLMIFLGFLGAEVLAKKYQECNNHDYIIVVNHYIANYYNKADSFRLNRFIFDAKVYLKQIFSLCNFISLIIIFTISLAFTIAFFWLELVGYINIIFSEDILKTVTSDQLWSHFRIVLVISIFIIFIKNIFVSIMEDQATKEDVAYTLQEMVVNNEYELLRDVVFELNKIISDNEKEIILNNIIDENAKSIIITLFKKAEDKE